MTLVAVIFVIYGFIDIVVNWKRRPPGSSGENCYYNCPICRELFPYFSVQVDELQWITSNIEVNEKIYFYYYKCNNIEVFFLSHQEYNTSDWENNTNPDTNFYDDVTLNYKYYTSNQVSAECKNDGNL